MSDFNIDFIEFSFLVEACIPPRPIARGSFWDDVINKHYDKMTQNERDRLFEWVNRCYEMEQGIKEKNEDCLLFNARFDKNNQYAVLYEFEGKTNIVNCFKWSDKYHISISQSVSSDYILEVSKISY